jgi:hypothetical protein
MDEPLSAPGVKVMMACPLTDTIESIVGASGGVAGITGGLVTDAVLVPAALVAVTEQV